MNESSVFRIRLISFGILALFLLIIVRLYLVQIVHGEDYALEADRQYVKPASTLFDRGTIFFETKDGSLITAAGLKSGFKLILNPTRVVNPIETYNQLQKFYKVDYESFMNKASKVKDPHEELAKELDSSLGNAIFDADIPGIQLTKERWRFYPGESTASQVLGFLSFKNDKYGAYYGLERQYDEVLSRNSGDKFKNFFTEILYGFKDHVIDKEKLEGDIILTIEPTVQGFVEDEIEEIQKKWSSNQTGVIVMDPKTGKIYAMASNPTFDLNNTHEVEDISIFSNPIVQSTYEMGSIVKPLTVAAGLDVGVITRESTFEDKGSVTFDSRTIYNFDRKVRGTVTMQDALNQSLNTGMAHIVQKLGKDRFVSYLKKFGIDKKTEIDLPAEAMPMTKNLDSGRMIEPVTASFGQGIALTPIGMTRALSILGNGGYVVTPHVVEKINYRIGTSKNIEPKKGEQVISEQTSEEITRMLVEVVDKALLGGKIKKEHYAIAAKTGTAQMAAPNGGYYDDRYLHSFFGYFPAYNPRFIVFLYTVYPKGVDYASHTLTEPFSDIADFLLSYYNIAPDR